MALTESEVFGAVVPGFVTDLEGNIAVVDTGDRLDVVAGFLTDDDGRLVVTDDDTGATVRDGFLRAPTGALVVTEDAGAYGVIPGFPTNEDGALSVVNEGTATWQGGFLRDAAGSLGVVGLSSEPVELYAYDWEPGGLGGWTSAATILRMTSAPYSLPACLLCGPWDFTASEQTWRSPAFDASQVSGVTLYGQSSGALAPASINLLELNASESELGSETLGTIPAAASSWTEYDYTPAAFSNGGVKAQIEIAVTHNGYWDGAGFKIDDVVVMGQP